MSDHEVRVLVNCPGCGVKGHVGEAAFLLVMRGNDCWGELHSDKALHPDTEVAHALREYAAQIEEGGRHGEVRRW